MWSIPLRDDLVGVEVYGPPQLEVMARMNSNENPFPPSDRLVADIAAAAAEATHELNRYPDRDFVSLRRDLADYLGRESGVTPDISCVWAANGSNEIMHHLFTAFGGPGRTALSFTPTYSMYSDYARDTFTGYVTEPRAEDFTLTPDRLVAAITRHHPTLTILTSPNNPTGTPLSLDAVRAACDAADGVIIVDEAYVEFRRDGTPSALTVLTDHPNLVVSRTMSKAFALAGARLGYLACGDARIVEALRVVRLPYHLSTVTQAVARTALAHSEDLLAQVDLLRRERDDLAVWLRDRGMEVPDSDANFLLFGRFGDRHAVWQGLLERGVLIRETGPDGWLRVSIGTPQDNDLFRESLLAVLGADEGSSR